MRIGVNEFKRYWFKHEVLAILLNNFEANDYISSCERVVCTGLDLAVWGVSMVVLIDDCELAGVLVIIIFLDVSHIDFELCVRDPKLHVEVNTFCPVIVSEVIS